MTCAWALAFTALVICRRCMAWGLALHTHRMPSQTLAPLRTHTQVSLHPGWVATDMGNSVRPAVTAGAVGPAYQPQGQQGAGAAGPSSPVAGAGAAGSQGGAQQGPHPHGVTQAAATASRDEERAAALVAAAAGTSATTGTSAGAGAAGGPKGSSASTSSAAAAVAHAAHASHAQQQQGQEGPAASRGEQATGGPGQAVSTSAAAAQAALPQPLSARQSAAGLLRLLRGLGLVDSGRFIGWDGAEVPW